MVELRRFLIIWLIVILFMGFFLILLKPLVGVKTDSLVHIEEDDPRWDCRTMGNKVCGL